MALARAQFRKSAHNVSYVKLMLIRFNLVFPSTVTQ